MAKVVVIGAGFAGHTAALYAAKHLETVYKSSITRKSPNHKPHHRSIDESLAHLG